MKVAMIAGEVSGDQLGAGLIQQLRKRNTTLKTFGVGGPKMLAQGFESFYDIERLSVMGIIEPLKRLPELLRMRADLYQRIVRLKPDIFVGIDAPDFNLGLEVKLRQNNIKVVHYVSPSVWAWRKKRIFKIAKACDLMLTLFPFEKKFYDAHDVPAVFVGHPLADEIPVEIDQAGAKKRLNLLPQQKYIALLPGSRQSEIENLSDVFIKTALLISKINPQIKFIAASANAKRDQQFKAYFEKLAPEIKVEFFIGSVRDVVQASDAVLVTSGTATLETMLLKRPMVVVYKMGYFSYKLLRPFVKLPLMIV